MNSRERVKAAINHQQPDKVPVDLGSTGVTGISASALTRLRKSLNLEDRIVKVHEPFQLLGLVEDDVMKAVGADVVGLWNPKNMFGFKNEGWKPWTLQDGTNVMIGRDFQITTDEKGDTFVYPKGDRSAKPSAKLPKGGFYFDTLVRQEEIDEDNMDGKKDYSLQYQLLNDEELEFLRKNADHLFNETEYAIFGNFGGAGIGDSAFLPGPDQIYTPGIRSVEEWLMAYYLNPDYILDAFEYQVDIVLKNLELYRQAVGDKIQVVYISGTDMGTQRSEFISPELFRKFYKPFYKRMTDWVHANTNWKTFFHSCGSIVNLLDDFVECGTDILNPVQCSAEGMDPQMLKDKYGQKLVFWGGGVNTQQTLPFGTPQEVYEEVQERLQIFSKEGGYIFNPIHNVQAPTRVENLLAMFDSVKNFNSKNA